VLALEGNQAAVYTGANRPDLFESSTMPCSLKNLELKAQCADLDAARVAAQRLGARPAGVELQTDTFFRVPIGRLKLRAITGRCAVLIWYDRPNRTEARLSSYYLVPVPDGDLLKALLAAALGVRGEVRKRREILRWHNVRIHLDRVDGLGTFVEFEAVLSPGEEEATGHERLGRLCDALSILPSAHIAASYSDLLEL
jgi:adenylate cyclase class IV